MLRTLLGNCGKGELGWAIIFLALQLLTFRPSIAATGSPSHFEQANRLYEQGKYPEAISVYESMIKGGFNSPGVYFNLGNAQFKLGSLGRALANYRQAARLSPRDPDIQANLRFTRERVGGSVSIQPGVGQRLFSYFKLDEIAIFAAILFWAWSLIFSLNRLRPGLAAQLRLPGLVTGSLLGLTLIFLIAGLVVQNERIAVVTVKQSVARLGPLVESQEAFAVSDGVELHVLTEREDWLQVRDRSDRVGWLQSTNAIVLEPFSRALKQPSGPL